MTSVATLKVAIFDTNLNFVDLGSFSLIILDVVRRT